MREEISGNLFSFKILIPGTIVLNLKELSPLKSKLIEVNFLGEI